MFEIVKIVFWAVAAASAILLVGGAVKKVISDPADECIESGQKLALGLVRASLSLGNASATAALPPT